MRKGRRAQFAATFVARRNSRSVRPRVFRAGCECCFQDDNAFRRLAIGTSTVASCTDRGSRGSGLRSDIRMGSTDVHVPFGFANPTYLDNRAHRGSA